MSAKFNSSVQFGVNHYAGTVFYDVDGFVEKNRESTNSQMRELLCTSSNALLRELSNKHLGAEEEEVSHGSSSVKKDNKGRRPSVNKLKEASISKQFVSSLQDLYDMLDNTESHYVRCVKPNGKKHPDALNSKETLLQLKNAGMMETIRIRKQV